MLCRLGFVSSITCTWAPTGPPSLRCLKPGRSVPSSAQTGALCEQIVEREDQAVLIESPEPEAVHKHATQRPWLASMIRDPVNPRNRKPKRKERNGQMNLTKGFIAARIDLAFILLIQSLASVRRHHLQSSATQLT